MIATRYGFAFPIWDASSGRLLKAFHGLGGNEILAEFSQDGKTLITLSRAVKLWDVKSMSPVSLENLEAARDKMRLLTASPDNMQVASALYKSGTIYLWDVESGTCRKTLGGFTETPSAIAYSLDSSHLASGLWDGTIKIWQLGSSICTRTLVGHSKPVMAVAFSTDGFNLVSGDSNGIIKIWEPDSAICVRTIVAGDSGLDSIGYSPDGQSFVSALQNGTVTVWENETGEERMSFRRRTGSLLKVSFSSDGQYIVSGASMTGVTIWRADTGVCVRSLKPRTSSFLDSINPYIRDPSVPSHYDYDIDKEGWIVWRGQRMLELPAGYISLTLTITSEILAVAGPWGKILFFKFSR
jgi:WD40 repeat protein